MKAGEVEGKPAGKVGVVSSVLNDGWVGGDGVDEGGERCAVAERRDAAADVAREGFGLCGAGEANMAVVSVAGDKALADAVPGVSDDADGPIGIAQEDDSLDRPGRVGAD